MNQSLPEAKERIAQAMARTMIEGFDKHYRIFRAASARAKELFEAGLWQQQLELVRDRVEYYDQRVAETVAKLGKEFPIADLDDATWRAVKLFYIDHLLEHKQPELAETFFNSVTTKILDRSYFNNRYLFARPAISTEFIESFPPVYTSYYPKNGGLRQTIRQILEDFDWERPFEDLDRDIGYVLRALYEHLGGRWPRQEVNAQIQVLYSPFYRNKSAYIIGKGVNGHDEIPFCLAIRHGTSGKLVIDTALFEAWRISVLFSLSRAYFLVDMEVPSGYVQFLRSIMPNKPRSELYTMLGLGKQGKTMFFRDLIAHLRHSNDQFIIAPGIRGMVMLVFTLPSYPYVFKIIKDRFGSSKQIDHATVRRKYHLVKKVDRVGRMADTLEFSHVALPLARFSPELLEELRREVPSQIDEVGDQLIIKHLYIERRMTPLNLFLEQASEAEAEAAIIEYGNAIRELAIANIFPGDMLWKNFGVTRYGRVVFYDYDEIEYMTDVHFRAIPPAPYPEMEMSDEPWYAAGPMDVFPEEFATFLLGDPKIRRIFMKHHRDLLTPEFWQRAQERIRAGVVEDFFPYGEEMRFCNRFQAG